MEKLLNLRLALVVLAAILGAFGLANAFVAVFFRADYEVTYQFDVTLTYCTADQCAYSAMLEVANTGRQEQPEVSVRLTGLPPGIGGSPKVINLSAAEPRAHDPLIDQWRDGDEYHLRLTGLAPGTLAQFFFRGSAAVAQVEPAREPQVSVSGRGKLIDGDPRAIAFGRWFG